MPDILHSVTILNVDDDLVGRYAITRALQLAGATVLEATTGPLALATASRNPVDLVLLDVNLPGMDGFEVLRRLKADSATAAIPVVFLSATSTDPGFITRGLEAGADGYLTEPVTPEVLISTVRAVLRMRRAVQELEKTLARLQETHGDLETTNEELAVANEELQNSYDEIERQRAFLEAVLQQVPIGISIGYDPSGRVVTTNQAGQEIYRVKPGENVSASAPAAERPANRYFQENRELTGDDLPMPQAVAQDRVLRDVEIEVRSPSGQPRSLLVNAAPVHDADGKIIGSVGVTWDVTEQRRAEEALLHALAQAEEGRRLLETLMDHVPIGITLSDQNLNLSMVSRYGQELLGEQQAGLSVAEVTAQRQVYEPDGVTPMPEEELPLVRAINQNEVVENQEIVQVNREGRRLWLLCNAAPLHDASGRVTGGVVAWADITERKQAEEQREALLRELRERRALLQAIVESASTGIAYYGPDLTIRMVNETYRENARLPREAIIGKRYPDLFPDSQTEAVFRRVLETKEPAEFRERPYVFASQPERGTEYYDWRLVPLLDEHGEIQGLISSSSNVTDRVRQREQLLAAERARAQLAENLSREIAHRTKNNLAMAAGLLQLQVYQQRDPQVGAALAETLSRLMTFASIQEELQSTTATGWVDLLPVLRRVGAASAGAFPGGEAVVSTTGESVALPSRAATNLAIVANELITNAIKHGAPGPDGKLRVDVRLEPQDDSLLLRVWNSGNSVPEDFDPAQQQGLGLQLVRDLARQYRGAFSLTPESAGTTANFTVPTEEITRT